LEDKDNIFKDHPHKMVSPKDTNLHLKANLSQQDKVVLFNLGDFLLISINSEHSREGLVKDNSKDFQDKQLTPNKVKV
jgi:hypothetical protein